ncbi:MAG: NAD-dependent epimerase/dehydratase family protein, partial [Planctomycetota bacterium]
GEKGHFMASSHALITGGAGFIGSHLAEHLLDRGWRVTALDNFSTGSRENVRHLAGSRVFQLVEGCASNYELVERLGADADVLFHLAAVVGVRKVVDNPVATVEMNHAATKTALHVAQRHGLRILITSSSEVYGANPKPHFSEDDSCMIGPTVHRRWCYSASKLMDEFHAFAFFHAHRLPVTVVRLFNTIGPRQVGHYGMVVPTFVRQALTGAPITVFGTGRQRRSFTYVKDVVESLRRLVETDASVGEVFNVGSTEESEILALAEGVKRLTESPSEIVFQSYREAYGEDFEDVERRCPDTTRLRRAIGYSPSTPLAACLPTIIESVRAEL